MTPSVYINLEDDVKIIAGRVKRQRSEQVVLVCPKHCFLFSDPINLKLLKTELDAAGKEVFILTMDEKGIAYAQAAGFGLRQVPGAPKQPSGFDIKPVTPKAAAAPVKEPVDAPKQSILAGAAEEIKSFTKFFGKKDEPPVVSPAQNAQSGPESDLLESELDKAEEIEAIEPEPQEFSAEVKDTIFPRELDEEMQVQKRTKTTKRSAILLFVLAIFVALAVVFVVLPRATVVVYPETESVSRDLEVTLSVSTTTPQQEQLIFPAVKVSETLDAVDSFQSQGKKEVGNKASGTVRIYNFTKLPIKLKSQTTTLSLNGKNYNLVDDLITIRPTKYANATTHEVDPSSLEDPFEIIASQGGESYNIPAGTRLEISNQVFGSKPQQLYAKTETPIIGGVSRYLSVVTQADVSEAQNQLKQNLLGQVNKKLADQGLSLLDGGFDFQVKSFSTDKAVNAESPTFSAAIEATINGLAFKKPDLDNLIFKHIEQTISNDKILQPDPNLSASYKIKSFDFSLGAAVLSAHFQSGAVSKVELGSLPGLLKGKTPEQVNEILNTKPEINRIDVTLAPSWQKTFPWVQSKIEVTVKN